MNVHLRMPLLHTMRVLRTKTLANTNVTRGEHTKQKRQRTSDRIGFNEHAFAHPHTHSALECADTRVYLCIAYL